MKTTKRISFIKFLLNNQNQKNRKIKYILFFKKIMTLITIIYFLIFPTNSLIKHKLVAKMSNLSPNLQKEIKDYLLPIPSRYEKHKNRELVKVINYLQLKNYTENQLSFAIGLTEIMKVNKIALIPFYRLSAGCIITKNNK